MPEYNFLTGNESDFPHIGNVNVYKYDNDFDYGRFDAPQMELQICSVPWDMGEAHIGNRTISGIGNVVYFETKAKRDKWFDDIPDSDCYRFTTKFKELHRSLEIDVPIPYDMCAKHNYLRVKYSKLANDNSLIQYEGNDGLREWFWFIREVEFLAPSTTRLHLLDDAFQTWIYDVNVSGMVLERGHAPMFEISAADYLANPIANNTYLLTEDVNFGEATQVSHIDAVALNAGTMYACIATTANPTATWTDKVPASSYYVNDGVPSVYVFAMQASNLNTFLTNIDATYPQFKQTIQAVFFASNSLVTLVNPFTFASVNCYGLMGGRKTLDFTTLDKAQFGYPTHYADIAKLYTSPYAHLEITDENGTVDVVKIEDTSGTIKISAMLSLAYPFINIDAHLTGVGGDASASVTFKNIDSKTFPASGQWYETLRTWQVPTFAVVLDPAKEYDYSTKFDRAQAVVDYTATQSNANASADTLIANAALQTTANTGVATYNNAQSAVSVFDNHLYNNAMASNANTCISNNATSTIAANEQQATIGAASSAIQSAVSAVGSAATGNIGGAVTGLINGLVGSASTLANMQVANSLTASQAQYAQDLNDDNASSGNANTSAMGTIQQLVTTETTTINNTYITSSTANTAATQKANAARDASTAQSAIDNGIAQAALREPFTFGTSGSGESAVTKPMALFAHVVTQSKSAIARAGDEFLRYGYAYDGQWDFDGDWNVGKYFTYWKLRDFWVSNLNVPDMYMDKLRFFLFGGVTVWRSPEYIGNVTVYDNFD